MSQNNSFYKETVERYCHVIGKNTTFNRYSTANEHHFECANKSECEKNGGCKHHIFSSSCSYKDKSQTT